MQKNTISLATAEKDLSFQRCGYYAALSYDVISVFVYICFKRNLK